MPIYMDLHNVPGVTAREVAEAHLMDVKIQERYLCKAMTYWLDEDKGCVFCLIEAPDKESVKEMHEKAHGLVPNEIILVNTDVVRAFLGRIQDPVGATRQPDTNLKVFSDSAFRIVLITRTMDARLLQHAKGKDRARELLLLHSTVVREQCRNFGGSEVYGKEEGFVISFTSPMQALDCAMAIRTKLQGTAAQNDLRIALHAGVPVGKDDSIFGETIRFGQFLCDVGTSGRVILSAEVRSQFKDNDWSASVRYDETRWLTTAEQQFLSGLLEILEANWQNAGFDVPAFCKLMSVSKSQLYRKCVAATGMSPNVLLREYRLHRALEILRHEHHNIAQTTFDAGFSSPSYFTRCFQKRFGLQPLAYLRARL